jgi:HK97 family phage major capsid protein
MTTPAGVTTGSFQGYPFPPDVQARILNLLVGGAPFGNSLTRQPTNRSSMVWPTARPTGFAWLEELQPFPTIGLDPDAYVVGVAKIGGIVDVSNESVSDSSINLTGSLSVVIRDSLSRDLDLGLLLGSGEPPEPQGVIANAPVAAGADLLAAVALARGEIADAGGTPSTIALSGTALAQADTDRDEAGQLIYPNGFAAAAGLTPVVVPELATPLVYDASRCFLVVRNDAQVEMSRDFHFHLDATSIRVKARVAAAIPDSPKAIRKLVIGTGSGPEPVAAPATASKARRSG